MGLVGLVPRWAWAYIEVGLRPGLGRPKRKWPVKRAAWAAAANPRRPTPAMPASPPMDVSGGGGAWVGGGGWGGRLASLARDSLRRTSGAVGGSSGVRDTGTGDGVIRDGAWLGAGDGERGPECECAERTVGAGEAARDTGEPGDGTGESGDGERGRARAAASSSDWRWMVRTDGARFVDVLLRECELYDESDGTEMPDTVDARSVLRDTGRSFSLSLHTCWSATAQHER